MTDLEVTFEDIDIALKKAKVYNTNSPVCSYCRVLIKQGVDPNTKLYVYKPGIGMHDNNPALIIRGIGEAAKLTIENDRYVKYQKPTINTPLEGAEKAEVLPTGEFK